MARRKRASMREGPLADLFRSTDESVGPEEVKVTAKSNGGGRVAIEEPSQETPLPEPVPEPTPEPVPEPTPDPVPEPVPGPEPVPEPTPPEPVRVSSRTSSCRRRSQIAASSPSRPTSRVRRAGSVLTKLRG